MKIRYYIEFKLMPELLFSDAGEFAKNFLSDKASGMTRIYQQVCEKSALENHYTDDDFEMMAQTLPDGNMLFRICMPKKDLEEPLCTDVFISLCVKTKKPRYITVEYENEDTSFICEVVPNGTHINHCEAPRDEAELIETIKVIAFSADDEEPEFLQMNPEDMSTRNALEYKVLPALFFNELNSTLESLHENGTQTIVSAYDTASRITGKPHSYTAEDFDFFAEPFDEKTGKTLLVIDMPRLGIVNGDALQVIVSLDFENMNIHYFMLEYFGEVRCSLIEVLPSQNGKFFRHGILPNDTDKIFEIITQLAFPQK